MASSVASASPTSILISLPARPPTPPREASHEADISRKSVVLGRALAFDPRLSLQTPPNANSPTSPVATASNPSSSQVRKKVEWSAHTDYQEPPQYPDPLRPAKYSPFAAASFATSSSKPVRGILKPSPSPNPLSSSLATEFDGLCSPHNIIEMLDSTIKQLAGSDRDSRLDAYMMLSRALKASNNLPDRVALQDKMSLFMQFIQRDMTAKFDTGNLDTSLINHSLTLLATFLHFPAIASTLTTDFGISVIDHSIRSFEDEGVPKDVVRHFMQVVAFQNFSAKVMSSDRVGRLVSALHKIENHLKGKSIVMSRLHIYKRLIKQARNHMSTHLDWLKDMFTDMLSSVKETRSQAISLGMEAGFALRSEKQLLRKATELFQLGHDSETFIGFYIKRLQGMIKDRQSCSSVPQIWGVVIMFLRCPLDRWQYYEPWLTLAQSAFNMTDNSTKQEANFAWNRYVYLSLSDTKVSPKCIGTLCQPLLSQLRRKLSPKQPEEAMKLRRTVIGGVCNLYYYAFAPGSDRYDLDVLWDVAVQPIISQISILDGKPDVPGDGMMQAARLLVGLLDVATPRIWRQDRIIDLPPVKSDELPGIESKWIRKNCDKVLQLVGPIIQSKFFDLANKDSLVYRLWQATVGSITAASAKDIKVSDETARFVGCAFGLLSTVLMTNSVKPEPGLASPNLKLLPSLSNFVRLLIDGLGHLAFTGKRLSMTVGNTFEPIATPSQRLDRTENSRGVVRTPLHHLFIMLASSPPGGRDDAELVTFLQSVFDPFFKGRSPEGRFELAKELLCLLPRNSSTPYGPWALAADCAQAYINKSPLLTTGQPSVSGNIQGPIFREVVSLIERGLSSHPNLPYDRLASLFDSVTTQAKGEYGDAGTFLIVIGPLSKSLLDISSEPEGYSALTLQAVTMLLNAATLPRDKQSLDAVRSRLWGAPQVQHKALASFEPFDNLYKLANHVLATAYDKQFSDDSIQVHPVIPLLLDALSALLLRNMPVFGVKMLGKLQAGLSVWIQDEKSLIRSESQSAVSERVANMWDQICSYLTTQERLYRQDLDKIEPLLTAAFKSPHRTILNRAAATWNTIVKENEEFEYSDSLTSLISSLRFKVDVAVPGVSEATGGSGAQTISRAGPLTDLSFGIQSSMSSHPDARAVGTNSKQSTSRRPLTRKQRVEATPEVRREKALKRTSTPRLRHDNSQIQFKPIPSSSPLQDESQHLTERQKEVRERQRQNAVLYSNDPSSPFPSALSLPKEKLDCVASESNKYVQQTTPKRGKSFEDLISSTPTPRRGEFFQMDDFNDPPSSPPLPRPYPLLSEIQSRSRAGSAMESWEFSSPPGSPSGNQQTEDAELPSTVSPHTEPPTRSRRSSKRQRRVTAEGGRSTGAVSSTQVGEGSISSVAEGKDQSIKPSLVTPAAQVEGVITRARKAQETPTSEYDSIQSSKPQSRRRSSRRVGAESQAAMVDETEAPGVAAESPGAAKHGIDALRPIRSPQSTDPTAGASNTPPEPRECIMVHTDSTCPSPEKLDKMGGETPPPPISLKAEPHKTTEADGISRRKRKRSGRHSEKGSKRRRPSNDELQDSSHQQTKQNDATLLESGDDNNLIEGIETRSGLRKRQQKTRRNEPNQTPKVAKQPYKTKRKNMDGGDTDEEVQSQLVTESNAASQLSQPDMEDNAASPNKIIEAGANRDDENLEDGTNINANSETQGGTKLRTEESVGGEHMGTIMETLRSGLDQLRSASLTRETVYEVEDILMDMKRELFEAEKRGRGRPRKRKSRGH